LRDRKNEARSTLILRSAPLALAAVAEIVDPHAPLREHVRHVRRHPGLAGRGHGLRLITEATQPEVIREVLHHG
jgi:hypothetical protein